MAKKRVDRFGKSYSMLKGVKTYSNGNFSAPVTPTGGVRVNNDPYPPSQASPVYPIPPASGQTTPPPSAPLGSTARTNQLLGGAYFSESGQQGQGGSNNQAIIDQYRPQREPLPTPIEQQGTTQGGRGGTRGQTKPETKAETAADVYKREMQRNQKNIDNATLKFQEMAEGFRKGTVPLNQYQSAQVKATEDSFKAVIDAQKLANLNYEQGTAVLNQNMGLSMYSPQMAMGNILTAVTEGNKRVADLNVKMNLAVAEMKQGFQESNYKQVKDAYEALTTAQKEKTSSIEKMYTVAKEQQEAMVKAQQDATLSAISKTLLDERLPLTERKQKIGELITSGNLTGAQLKEVQTELRTITQNDIENELNSDKFSWEQKQDLVQNALDREGLDLDWAKLALDRAKLAQDDPITGSAAMKEEQDAQSARLDTINLIDNVLNNPLIDLTTGFKRFGAKMRSFVLPDERAPLLNQFKQITAILSLENREKLKGSGAISDFESRTLEKSASAFSLNLSPDAAKKQLRQVNGVLKSMSGIPTSVKVKDPSTGEFQILELSREAIEDAVRSGLLVEYQ